jgi:predicted DNA-binding transcriptional regulator YafY
MFLRRVHHIAAALTVRKRTTVSLLATELEVCPKTVARDIEYMRGDLGLPIEADIAGHYFAQPVKLCRCCARRVRN